MGNQIAILSSNGLCLMVFPNRITLLSSAFSCIFQTAFCFFFFLAYLCAYFRTVLRIKKVLPSYEIGHEQDEGVRVSIAFWGLMAPRNHRSCILHAFIMETSIERTRRSSEGCGPGGHSVDECRMFVAVWTSE